MVSEVRTLLETYELNTTHLVVKNGRIEDGKITCDTNDVHIGDLTQYGKIVAIGLDTIECEQPISESPLKVKVFDYVSDDFINKTFEEQVKPIVLRYAPLEVTECEEYCKREGDHIYLSHRDIGEIQEIEGHLHKVDRAQGIVYGTFSLDQVKIRYIYGGDFPDVKRACVLLTASFVLGFIGSATGGGSLNVQGYGRNYGARGKYHDVRQELDRNAYQLLQKHVVGMV